MACLLLFAAVSRLPADPPAIDLFGGADFSAPASKEADPKVTATLTAQGEFVTLTIRVDLPEGGNTYSQDPSFSKPTKFNVQEALGLTAVDPDFTPDHPPKRAFDENFNKEVEKYFGTVTWSRKYRLLDGADLNAVSVSGKVSLLYCLNSCRALNIPFKASLGAAAPEAVAMPAAPRPKATSLFDDLTAPGAEDVPPPVEDLSPPTAEPLPAAAAAATGDTKPTGFLYVPQYGDINIKEGDPASVEVALEQGDDGLAVLSVLLRLAPEYHVNALTTVPDSIQKPTLLEITGLQGLRPVGQAFLPDAPPAKHMIDLGDNKQDVALWHLGQVRWTRVFELDPGAQPGLAGMLQFQVCKGESFCLKPQTVRFSFGSLSDPSHAAAGQPLATPLASDVRQAAIKAAGNGSTAGSGDALTEIGYAESAQSDDLSQWLLYAFLGGLILNVMPCVLPVISIKALSFVHQAGEQPGRILLLNLVYSLGVLAVFSALATLAVTLKLGWGAQNQSAAYNIVMVVVVFAMGLSLLGVFEIPIPGMMSSGLGGRQHGEGLVGAFLTGILATLLATPCTGPYMATTLFWSLKQPVHIVYLVFGVMGLGMASPYLLIGCFPKLIDWLPRPGQWMVTFKQASGFALMGTAVWMLNTIHGLNTELVIPTLVILVGVATFVWMIGQLYDLSSTDARRWVVRGIAGFTAGPIIALGAYWARQAVDHGVDNVSESKSHGRGEHVLPWQPFSSERLRELVAAGTPVLIDFTADWCGICKANELRALNTATTSAFVKEHGFVTLVADFTRESQEIRDWLNRFGQDSVPLTVIIPGGRPGETKLLRESFSQSDLIEKLQEAIATGDKPSAAATTTAAETPPTPRTVLLEK